MTVEMLNKFLKERILDCVSYLPFNHVLFDTHARISILIQSTELY